MFDCRPYIAPFTIVLSCLGCSDGSVTPTDDRASLVHRAEDVATISREYKKFKLMTPEPVFVNPELASLCIGPFKEMVDAARENDGPHANCTVSIYMNSIAAKAFNQSVEYPMGAIVVKEKRMLGYLSRDAVAQKNAGRGNGVGGMIKRHSGFDSENGNWEYFYFETVDNVETGRMASCIECHAKAKSSDFVFGSWKDGNNMDQRTSGAVY